MAAKNVVIVESPARTRTRTRSLARYLGRDCKVRASVGHLFDLPKNKLGVNVDRDSEPEPDYEVIRGKGKGKGIEELKSTGCRDSESIDEDAVLQEVSASA